jgi:predicted transposase YbfD/YdcC
MLSLKGAIVSIDAMGTQKQIAQRIVDKDADYVLALKGNHIRRACTRTRRSSSPTRPALQLAPAAPRPTPAMAGSKSAHAASPRQAGSPLATPAGRACARSPPSVPGASTGSPAAKASRPASTSLPWNPTRKPSSPCARIGASKTICIGRWVTFDEDRCRTRKDASPLNFATSATPATISSKPIKRAVPSDENDSEPASTQPSAPAFSPLNDLGLCPVR